MKPALLSCFIALCTSSLFSGTLYNSRNQYQGQFRQSGPNYNYYNSRGQYQFKLSPGIGGYKNVYDNHNRYQGKVKPK